MRNQEMEVEGDMLRDATIEVDGDVNRWTTASQAGEWEHVHRSLVGIADQRAKLDARELHYLVEAEQLKLWRQFGYVTMREYLERELGYGPREATERLRIARRLAELPTLGERLADGTFKMSAVRELTRVATPDTEDEWIDAAMGKSLREIEQLVSGHKPGGRPGDKPDPDLKKRNVTLELTPSGVAYLRQARSQLAEELGHGIDDDTLMEVLYRRAFAGEASGKSAPAYQIHLTVCEHCRRGWQNGAGREMEVSGATVERACCDGMMLGHLDADPPERATPTVSPRRRAQVLARDGHCCIVPGCRSARNLCIHHLVFQMHGGTNAPWNLVTLCDGHHKALHDGLISITGKAPDKLEFRWHRLPIIADHEVPVLPAGDANDARMALVGLGFRPGEKGAVVESARTHVGADAGLELASNAADARAALVGLGFRPGEARAAVDAALAHVGMEVSLEALIRRALQECPRRGSG